jgi:deoxyribose-phosphate aldolase
MFKTKKKNKKEELTETEQVEKTDTTEVQEIIPESVPFDGDIIPPDITDIADITGDKIVPDEQVETADNAEKSERAEKPEKSSKKVKKDNKKSKKEKSKGKKTQAQTSSDNLPDYLAGKDTDEILPPLVLPTDLIIPSAETPVSEEDLFPLLSSLFNKTVKEIKEECFVYQIRKFMSRLGKVVVRYNVPDPELEKIFLNADALKLGGILVAPIYLPACKKISKKHRLSHVSVGSLIDFPFGESSFKGKVASVREGMKIGIDTVHVTIPNMLLESENIKQYKSQAKKIGKLFKEGSGIILNATDLSEDSIKKALKIAAKTKLTSVTFSFGEATLEQVKSKLDVVNKYRGSKKIYVLANVDRAEAVTELMKLSVDMILTPYADDIGRELVRRFNTESVKLR